VAKGARGAGGAPVEREHGERREAEGEGGAEPLGQRDAGGEAERDQRRAKREVGDQLRPQPLGAANGEAGEPLQRAREGGDRREAAALALASHVQGEQGLPEPMSLAIVASSPILRDWHEARLSLTRRSGCCDCVSPRASSCGWCLRFAARPDRIRTRRESR
jgi:hypothetical protein